MISTFVLTLAQTTAPAAPASAGATGPGSILSSPMIVPFLLIAVFFIFMTRNNKKQKKQAEDLRNNLKKGDRVQTIGGILGTVVEARETEVLLKVDETNNTKIRFSRNAIHRVLTEGDETAVEKK